MTWRFSLLSRHAVIAAGVLLAVLQLQAKTAAESALDLDDAIALALAGDLAAGEKILFEDNPSRPNSFMGRVESAQDLVQLALSLKSIDRRVANTVAHRALAFLGDGKKNHLNGSKPLERARYHEIAGMIYERLLPDAARAEAAYAQAMRENPNSKMARAGLDRAEGEKTRVRRLTEKK